MRNLLNEIRDEGYSQGEAIGKIAEIRRLVANGRMTVDEARAEIGELISDHSVPEALGRDALGLLG